MCVAFVWRGGGGGGGGGGDNDIYYLPRISFPSFLFFL